MATATQVTKPQTAPAAPRPQVKKLVQLWIWEAKSKQGEVKKGEMEANDANAVELRL